jgi:hypothetical protein
VDAAAFGDGSGMDVEEVSVEDEDESTADAFFGKTFFRKYELCEPTTFPGGVYSQTTYQP